MADQFEPHEVERIRAALTGGSDTVCPRCEGRRGPLVMLGICAGAGGKTGRALSTNLLQLRVKPRIPALA